MPLKIRRLLYVLVCLGMVGWVCEDPLTCAAFGPEVAVYLAVVRSEFPHSVGEEGGESRVLPVRDPWGRGLMESWTEDFSYPPGVMSPRVSRNTIYSCGPNGVDERGEGDDVGIKDFRSSPGLLALAQLGRASLFLAFLAALAMAVPSWPWRRAWIPAGILGAGVAWLATRGMWTIVLESKPMGAMLSTQASVVLGGAFAAVVVAFLTGLVMSTEDHSRLGEGPSSVTG